MSRRWAELALWSVLIATGCVHSAACWFKDWEGSLDESSHEIGETDCRDPFSQRPGFAPAVDQITLCGPKSFSCKMEAAGQSWCRRTFDLYGYFRFASTFEQQVDFGSILRPVEVRCPAISRCGN
jgi:hypothetical protein